MLSTAQTIPDKTRVRRYVTVSLSDKIIVDGEAYYCHRCKSRVTTVHNEPKAQIEVKVNPNDTPGVKIVENLCKQCNTIYIFV